DTSGQANEAGPLQPAGFEDRPEVTVRLVVTSESLELKVRVMLLLPPTTAVAVPETDEVATTVSWVPDESWQPAKPMLIRAAAHSSRIGRYRSAIIAFILLVSSNRGHA